MMLIFENIRSTAADECGKTNKYLMNSAKVENFAFPIPFFTSNSSCQKVVGDRLKF